MTDPITRLTPEEKLLISLCRLDFSEEQKAEIRDLMNEIKDWDHFVKLANDHGIIALTAHNIRGNGLAGFIQEKTMNLLDNGRMQSMIRNTWLVQRWKEVNKILCDAGIKHVLLKGMALEHTLYGAMGLRQMTDNDILVKKEDALKAWLLLKEYGFQSGIIKSPLHRKIITEIGKHMPTLIKDGYAVEIHHRLFQETEKNTKLDDAIDNAVEITIEGTKAYILNDNIHLNYLKEHNKLHLSLEGSQLRLFLDMELIKPGSAPELPAGFLSNPLNMCLPKQGKNAYRTYFSSLPQGIRFRFLMGDIFPSLKWMKKRYGCGWAKAILYYPLRLGKVVRLL